MTVSSQYQVAGRTATAIASSVEQGVAAGVLVPGKELPSVRGLAAELGVSPATVASAYRTLRQRGVVVSAARRGVRVAPRVPLVTRAPSPLPPGVRDLAGGNPDPALLPRLPGLQHEPTVPPRLYGQEADLPQLVELAAEGLVADGIRAEAVGVCSGALDGVERVLGAHLRPGDRVAVEDPGYTGVLDLARAMGLELVGVGLDARGVLPEALDAALRTGVRAAVVTPRAQNPTGAAFDRERAETLTAVLAEHPDVLLVEDDHAGPVAGAPHRTLAAGRARWAVLRSVSKSLGPDLRLAVLAGDRDTVARVEARQRLGPGWVSHVLQRLVATLWRDPEVQEGMRTAAGVYAQRRSALATALAAHGIAVTAPSGLNVWIPVRDELEVVRGLERAGWGVQPGEPYRLAASPAVRVTTAALPAEDAPRLAADLAALLRPSDRTSPA